MKVVFLLIYLILSNYNVSFAFNIDEFKRESISDIIIYFENELKSSNDNNDSNKLIYNIECQEHKSVIKCIYTGNFRNISKDRLHLIKEWLTAKGVTSPKILNIFKKEVKILHEGKPYWIPTQTILIKPMKKEMSKGQTFDIYVYHVGSISNDYVFAMQEFIKN